MAQFKVTRRWANSIADGSNDLFSSDGFQPENGMKIEGLADLYREGQSQTEVLVKLGISRNAYYNACAKSPKFKEAHDEGLLKSEAWWATLGRAGAAGKTKVQPATYIFTMKNRFGWSDKKELTAKVTNIDAMENTTINPEMTPEDAAKIYNAEILNKS